MSYSGELQVEEGDFFLEIQSLIVRDDEIVFMMSGNSDEGEFKVDGVAKLTEHGFFMAPRLAVDYTQYVGESLASVRIDRAQESPKKTTCRFSGLWIEEGEDWKIEGTLQKST